MERILIYVRLKLHISVIPSKGDNILKCMFFRINLVFWFVIEKDKYEGLLFTFSIVRAVLVLFTAV